MKNKIEQLGTAVFLERDVIKARQIYQTIDIDKIMPELNRNIYKMIPFLAFFVFDYRIDELKSFLDILNKEKSYLSKYEMYIYYYYYGQYFTLVDQNFQATQFAFELIDLKKLKKYLDCDFKEYIYADILINIGSNLTYLFDFEAAKGYYDNAYKVLKKKQCKNCINEVEIVIVLYHLNVGEYEKALDLLYLIQKECNDVPIIVFIVIGFIEFLKGKYKKASFFTRFNLLEDNYLNIKYHYYIDIYSKYLISLANFHIGDTEESVSVFNSISRPIHNSKEEQYFHKLIEAYINKDYSIDTYNFIVNKVYDYFIKSNQQWRIDICKMYLDNKE